MRCEARMFVRTRETVDHAKLSHRSAQLLDEFEVGHFCPDEAGLLLQTVSEFVFNRDLEWGPGSDFKVTAEPGETFVEVRVACDPFHLAWVPDDHSEFGVSLARRLEGLFQGFY